MGAYILALEMNALRKLTSSASNEFYGGFPV